MNSNSTIFIVMMVCAVFSLSACDSALVGTPMFSEQESAIFAEQEAVIAPEQSSSTKEAPVQSKSTKISTADQIITPLMQDSDWRVISRRSGSSGRSSRSSSRNDAASASAGSNEIPIEIISQISGYVDPYAGGNAHISPQNNQVEFSSPHQEEGIQNQNYPEWLSGCTRYQPIFSGELSKYPVLSSVIELPMMYALVYQESECQTAEEFRRYKTENSIFDDESWKGGIMQVDACWRWGAPYDCTTVEQQIMWGMYELNKSYAQIDAVLNAHSAQDSFTNKEKIALLLLAYNRGFSVADEAIALVKNKKDRGDFQKEGLTKSENGRFLVFVNCPEKDLCTNDNSFVEITDELDAFPTDAEKASLIACRSKYGFMSNSQGDYCTGPGYGLMYAKRIFGIYDEIGLQNNQ